MFNKVFVFFASVLFAWEMFLAGFNFANNETQLGITNLILAALWSVLLVLNYLEVSRRSKLADRLVEITDEAMAHVAHVIEKVERDKAYARTKQTVAKPTNKSGTTGKTSSSRTTARQSSKKSNK